MSDTENTPPGEPALEPSEANSVYIRYKEETADELAALLAQYDEAAVISGRNFFIVTQESSAARDAAKERLEEALQGKDVLISDYRKSMRQKRMEEVRRKVYVAEFPDETGEDELREAFAAFGEVEEVVVLRSPSKDNKPFAFVRYASEAEAKAAAESSVEIGGSKVMVEMSRPKPFTGRLGAGRFLDFVETDRPFPRRKPRAVQPREPLGDTPAKKQSSVLITNFDESVTKIAIRKEAESCGEIAGFRLFKDHAIVTYRSIDSVQKAVDEINGKDCGGKKLVVIIAPKGSYARSSRRNPRRGGRRGRKSTGGKASGEDAEKAQE